VLGLEHRVRLALQERALGAFAKRRAELRRGAFDQSRVARDRAVLLQDHPEYDEQLRRVGGTDRRVPALTEPLPHGVDFRLRKLVIAAFR
jgi:hypothetical protein